MPPLAIIVTGVSGCGKTTAAAAIARALAPDAAVDTALFLEADDFHAPGSIAKMRSGRALTDEDRWPWLDALGQAARERLAEGRSCVMTCSALRRVYRERLVARIRGRAGAGDARLLLVFLAIDQADALSRVTRRASDGSHFMPAALIASQFATLEPPTEREAREVGYTLLEIDATASPEDIGSMVRAAATFG